MTVKLSVVLALALVSQVFGLMMDLPPNGRKCLREEVHKDVLVTGEFEMSEVPGQRTDLIVSVLLFKQLNELSSV